MRQTRRKTKTGLALLLLMAISCISINPAVASAKNISSIKDEYGFESASSKVITDSDELQQIVVDDNLDVPKGYTLVKVEVTVVNSNSNTINNTNSLKNNVLDSTGISITSIKDIPDVYFVNDYVSNWYYGPCTISEEFSQERSVSKEASVGISNDIVEAKYGVTIGKKITNTSTFNAAVSAGNKLNVQIFTNYHQYYFSIKSGSQQIGTGSIYVPMGLIIKQYTYKV
jgi:hypothetical protein